MTTPKPALNSDRYGYGFGIQPDGSVGHSGGLPGISSNLAFWIDEGWVAVVMANVSRGSRPVARRLSQLASARLGDS